MRILITGGAGFIGSEMVRQLAGTTHKIFVVDSLTYAGNENSFAEVKESVHFTKLDIRDKNSVAEYFLDFQLDVVVNFAAETHVDNSIQSPGIFLETNILGTFNLLESARKHKFRFLQISTDEVYGSTTKGSFTEEDKLNPSSPYSASKASAEMMMEAYVKTYSVEALGVRCSNNYGHFQNREKLIPFFISKVLKGEKLPLYGNGENVREWIHVSDSVAAIIGVLNKGRVGEFYNISSGDFITNVAVTHKIVDFMKYDRNQIEYVKDRLGHDFRYAIDSSKVRSETGWKPQIEFDTGLGSTIDWYLAHPEYLKGSN